MKNNTVIILISVLAVALYTVAVIDLCLGDVLSGIVDVIMATFCSLMVYTLHRFGQLGRMAEQKMQERQRIGQRFADERKSVEWVDANGVKRKGMTQAELAERCGLLQSNIARVERGYFSVGFDTLEAMAEGLGKKIDIV